MCFFICFFSSVTQSCPTLRDPMNHSTPGLPVYHQLPELIQTHVHWVGDAIQPPHPLSSPTPLTFNHSQHQGLFKWVSSFIRWPKYWHFSFNISPSNGHSGLIFFRMEWLDLLAVQETLKSLLQHQSSKASVPQCSDFFRVQLSHPSVTIGKTIALTRQTFVGKVMSLLFNMLSRLVITFLSRSKRLLISWLQSPSTVILEPPKIKSVTVSTVSPPICLEDLCNHMDNIVHGILQARILEWVAFPFSSGSSQHRNRTRVSCITGVFFTNWAISLHLTFIISSKPDYLPESPPSNTTILQVRASAYECVRDTNI